MDEEFTGLITRLKKFCIQQWKTSSLDIVIGKVLAGQSGLIFHALPVAATTRTGLLFSVLCDRFISYRLDYYVVPELQTIVMRSANIEVDEQGAAVASRSEAHRVWQTVC